MLERSGLRLRPLPRPVDQKPRPLTHERSSVGARPSSAAPVDQNQHPLTHERSSVGARPSPAAHVDQNKHPLTHEPLLSERGVRLGHRSESVDTQVLKSKHVRWGTDTTIHFTGLPLDGAPKDGCAPTEEKSFPHFVRSRLPVTRNDLFPGGIQVYSSL